MKAVRLELVDIKNTEIWREYHLDDEFTGKRTEETKKHSSQNDKHITPKKISKVPHKRRKKRNLYKNIGHSPENSATRKKSEYFYRFRCTLNSLTIIHSKTNERSKYIT